MLENLKMLGMQSIVSSKDWPCRFENTWGPVDHSDFAAAMAMGLADVDNRPSPDPVLLEKQLLLDIETAWSELK